MYYVYILLRSNGTKYVGYTNDLRRRIIEHKTGKVRSTNKLTPKLIYYEAYVDKSDATSREIYLKSGDGRKDLIQQLKNTLNNK
jgi:putative endonuclease